MSLLLFVSVSTCAGISVLSLTLSLSFWISVPLYHYSPLENMMCLTLSLFDINKKKKQQPGVGACFPDWENIAVNPFVD